MNVDNRTLVFRHGDVGCWLLHLGFWTRRWWMLIIAPWIPDMEMMNVDYFAIRFWTRRWWMLVIAPWFPDHLYEYMIRYQWSWCSESHIFESFLQLVSLNKNTLQLLSFAISEDKSRITLEIIISYHGAENNCFGKQYNLFWTHCNFWTVTDCWIVCIVLLGPKKIWKLVFSLFTAMIILIDGMDFTSKFYGDPAFTRSTSYSNVVRRNEGGKVIVAATFPCGMLYLFWTLLFILCCCDCF